MLGSPCGPAHVFPMFTLWPMWDASPPCLAYHHTPPVLCLPMTGVQQAPRHGLHGHLLRRPWAAAAVQLHRRGCQHFMGGELDPRERLLLRRCSHLAVVAALLAHVECCCWLRVRASEGGRVRQCKERAPVVNIFTVNLVPCTLTVMS